MNKIFLSIIFILSSYIGFSQKVYFVYLQTDGEQTFFVKMNGKVQSSTSAGYLIIPKLLDTVYNFTVGFPANKWPEQSFSITINKKDHGYLLKNFEEKGWGLFDLQTLQIQMSSMGSAKLEGNNEIKESSVFTEMLSKAADDPTLKERKAEPVVLVEKKEEVKAEKVEQTAEIKNAETQLVNAEVYKATTVSKQSENSTTDGLGLIYVDESGNGLRDTIQLMIPNQKPETQIEKTENSVVVEKKTEPLLNENDIKSSTIITPADSLTVKNDAITETPVEKKEEIKQTGIEQPVKEKSLPVVSEAYKTSTVKRRSEFSMTEGFGLVFIDDLGNGVSDTIRLLISNPKQIVTTVKNEPVNEKKFLDIPVDSSKKAEEKIIESIPVIKENPVEKMAIKNNCIVNADQTDFFKVRKLMAAVESDDDMIDEAKKYFKTRCFNTEQLKNLSLLFLNDAGKYRFFDMAYNYTSDVENFSALQKELKEAYYINRFKAMLRN